MFLIYYLVKESFSLPLEFDILVKTISILSILVSLGGIFESLFAFNPIYEYFIENPYYQRYITGFVRPMSTQYNPVVLGSYLLGCLPFNFLLFKQGKSFFRLLGATAIVLNIVVIILTFSRGVLLGLITMIGFYIFAKKRYRLLAIFFIFLFIFIFICSYLPYPLNRFGKDQMTVANRGILSSYRLARWVMTGHIIMDYPLTGLGFQHFRLRFYEYYPFQHIIPYEFMIADNMYLTILAETGIIGFLGFLMFILYFLSKGYRQLLTLKHKPERREQLLIVLTAFVGLLINMGAYELFYWSNQYMYFCILIGCLGSFYREKQVNGDRAL